ncbi:hypothetical protein [Amycolatopsis sp. TNS106]|uniref:hypothetical protein n=1 Tax=Amycolatopsis sp. TNS106 TaxID=2861750 RepID=UPI001C59D143|nr:hypothetical protein [Amycolatopsis sp. TNS106]
MNPKSPVTITDASGRDISNDVLSMLMSCFGDIMNAGAEQSAKELLGQTMVNFDPATPLPVGELFATQAGHRNKLPAPSARVLYTAQNDVVPAAKSLLAGAADDSLFFTSLAYSFHPNTLGFWFQSAASFDTFKTWLSVQIAAMRRVVPSTTSRLLTDFAALRLNDLTESLLLRKDDGDGNEEHSFPRVLLHMLMQYVDQHRAQSAATSTAIEVGVLPFTVGELFCPQSVVLVNVEAHARTSAAKITAEWGMINQSLASPLKIVSHRNLSKLTSLPRAAARAAAIAALPHAGQPTGRSARVAFRKQPPSKIDLFKDIKRVLRRMRAVARSQNVFRTSRTTFLKANRRTPDDYNKPGRITSTSYLPDLHIYVDTSGSISEANYQEAVMMLIRIAKRLNINLYFNSFSHILSQESLLRVENKSEKQIWHTFSKVPKVTGGTNFQQVWRYINASATRKRQLSLMITDFDWAPPATREEHPPNLYYAPCSAMDWPTMVDLASKYADAMQHIDPSIRQKLLGMVV